MTYNGRYIKFALGVYITIGHISREVEKRAVINSFYNFNRSKRPIFNNFSWEIKRKISSLFDQREDL